MWIAAYQFAVRLYIRYIKDIIPISVQAENHVTIKTVIMKIRFFRNKMHRHTKLTYRVVNLIRDANPADNQEMIDYGGGLSKMGPAQL